MQPVPVHEQVAPAPQLTGPQSAVPVQFTTQPSGQFTGVQSFEQLKMQL
jgi:hypothetical protein